MRNLSKHQFGTLKYIDSHDVTLETLQIMHAGTIWSLLHNAWVVRHGSGPHARVELSKDGKAELEAYKEASYNQRMHAAPITDRCADLLRVSRMQRERARVVELPRKAG